jgi:hypothetical protein
MVVFLVVKCGWPDAADTLHLLHGRFAVARKNLSDSKLHPEKERFR